MTLRFPVLAVALVVAGCAEEYALEPPPPARGSFAAAPVARAAALEGGTCRVSVGGLIRSGPVAGRDTIERAAAAGQAFQIVLRTRRDDGTESVESIAGPRNIATRVAITGRHPVAQPDHDCAAIWVYLRCPRGQPACVNSRVQDSSGRVAAGQTESPQPDLGDHAFAVNVPQAQAESARRDLEVLVGLAGR